MGMEMGNEMWECGNGNGDAPNIKWVEMGTLPI